MEVEMRGRNGSMLGRERAKTWQRFNKRHYRECDWLTSMVGPSLSSHGEAFALSHEEFIV